MTDFHKLAEKIFPSNRLETGSSKLEQTSVVATATSDSSNGYVSVSMPGPVTYAEGTDDTQVLIPTGPSIREGDQVHISLTGGVGKSPIVTNAAGWGDRLASETIEIANEAMAVASATNQHFWTDTNGAHVTDVTQDQWHEAEEDDFSDLSDQKPYHNALWNSLGMLFRSGLKNLVSITRSAIAFFNGTGNTSDDIVAQFGKDGFQIGINDESHLIGDYHSLNLIDKEDNTYFEVADLRDHNGEAVVTEHLGAFAQRPYLYPSYKIDELIFIEGEGQATYTVDPSGEIIYMDPMPTRYESVIAQYKTSDVRLKSYTLGVRNSDPAMPSGGLSVVEGYMNSAVGKESHAEGAYNNAWGGASHVEGNHTVAYSDCDHAEGYYTQAGSGSVYNWVTANHAEGSRTKALGEHSHAQNIGTIAYTNQTAIGSYNVADDHNVYAFMIGNGTSDQNRSNCLAVKWNGDIVTSNGNSIIGSSKVLYNNATGSNSTITLSESAANYDYMRIYFKKNSDSNSYSSVDIYQPNGKTVSLVLNNPYESTNSQVVGRTVSISGTSITNFRREIYGNTGNSGILTTTDTLSIYITRVEAWNGGANIASAGSGGGGAVTGVKGSSETDYRVGNVDISYSNVGAAASSHSHGSITNAGAITSDTVVANGDKLIISDSSDSSKLKRSGIAIGTATNTYLRNDGQWATPASTDTKVTQTVDSSTNGSFPVLFKNTTETTTVTDTSKFNANVTVNPSTGNIQANKVNNYTLAEACAKGVDTIIASGSTSTNLPTSAAVASYVASQGGGGGGTVDMPTGTVTMFAGSSAPIGWLICDGSAVNRATYAALFSVIGTTYGTGDGSSTFNLPNLQGKFALGKDSSYALGSTGGAATVTLTTANLPAHTHGSKTLTGETSAWYDTGLIGGSAVPVSGGIVQKGSHTYNWGPDWAESTAYSLKVDATHEHDSVGSGTAHNNMPPYQAINYIIKY